MKKIYFLAALALVAMSCQQPANKSQQSAATDSTATAAAQPKVDAYTSATNSGEKLTKKEMAKPEAVAFIANYMKDCPNFFLASADPQRPHVRPLGMNFVYNGNYYIGVGDFKASYKELCANPNIEICAKSKKPGSWMRIIATVVPDTTSAAQEEAFKSMPQLKKMYNETTGHKIGLFYLSKVHAEFSNAQQGFDVIEFE